MAVRLRDMRTEPSRCASLLHSFLVIPLFLAVPFFLGACGNNSGAGTSKLQIAVIPKGTTHEFWKAVHAGVESAAQELSLIHI